MSARVRGLTPRGGLFRVDVVGGRIDIRKYRRCTAVTLTTLAVATHVNAGTITSSPGPIPSAASARWSAVVHEVVATPCATPWRSANSRSNSATLGPWVSQPLSRGSLAGLPFLFTQTGAGDRDGPYLPGGLLAHAARMEGRRVAASRDPGGDAQAVAARSGGVARLIVRRDLTTPHDSGQSRHHRGSAAGRTATKLGLVRDVLVVYDVLQWPPVVTVRDSLYAFERHSSARCWYLNLGVRRVPRWLARVRSTR